MDKWKLLEQIAADLHGTADHVWTVLVTQALLSSVSGVVGSLVFTSLLGWLTILFSKMWKEAQRAHEVPEGWFIASIVCGLFCFVCCCVLVEQIYWVAVALINPEYWALRKLMVLMK